MVHMLHNTKNFWEESLSVNLLQLSGYPLGSSCRTESPCEYSSFYSVRVDSRAKNVTGCADTNFVLETFYCLLLLEFGKAI